MTVSFSHLSDSSVVEAVTRLSRKENEGTAELLLFLLEMDRRKAYVELGFSSLFSFCTERLLYSAPAAWRRIATARACGVAPELYALFLQREVSLTTVSMVSKILTPLTREVLVDRIRGKSKEDVEDIVASYKLCSVKKDKVRPIYVTPLAPKESPLPLSTVVAAPEMPLNLPLPAQEKKFEIRCTVSEKVMELLHTAERLLSTKYPKGITLEEVFQEVVGEYVERRTPKVKLVKAPKEKGPEKKSRYIPKAVQEEVKIRDEERCVFIGTDGTRCTSSWCLQNDHKDPWARGGENGVSNIRLLCFHHNRFEAERIFGKAYIEKRIRDSRQIALAEEVKVE